MVEIEVEVAGQQVAGARGDDPDGHTGAGQLRADLPHGAVAAADEHEVGAGGGGGVGHPRLRRGPSLKRPFGRERRPEQRPLDAVVAPVLAAQVRGQVPPFDAEIFVRAVVADVRSSAQLQAMVDTALQCHGRIDILHNNVGIEAFGDLLELTEASWDRVHEINLRGAMLAARAAMPHMIRQGGGSIINVSSSGSIRPAPDMLPYAAAKAGLNALTEGLAKAFGPTVRVNTLMAGPYLTDISKAWNLSEQNNPFRHLPLQRAGDPREIVGAALFLMSDASSFTTGSILRADGGFA